ncbi:MAG TPA: glycosyltransferase family 39 protein [Steroidobacteraceae bacterium]|nr:glycosyltransferase family 39 protein [Steroidobacteraceae bacterium]
MSNAATRAATPVITILNGAIAGLLRSFGQLFVVTAPAVTETVLHRLLLVVVLGAGIVVRFWGLGAHGLHGDEETMAMATMHIVKDGLPILPSGMLYPRGLSELYLMAASVLMFGESEWAFRLPSALAGVALIYLCYVAGRRFLRPSWCIALAAAAALLPDALDYSQTARMYIFMLACIAGALACLFAWERSGRIGWLIGAVLALIVGIELHALTVTMIPLLLLPGLLQGDRRRLLHGLIAGCVVMVAYLLFDGWVNSQYPVPPPEYASDLSPPGWRGSRAQHYPVDFQIALLVSGAAAAIFAVHLARKVPRTGAAVATLVLMGGALGAQLLLYYHVAALLGVAGLVVAYRATGPVVLRRSWIFVLACAVIALTHVTFLAARPGSILQLVGALIGEPSVWPYVRMAEFSLAAAVLTAAAALHGLWRIANRRRAPDYTLVALLGVGIPLFTLGLFSWDMPSRYTSASLVPMLLCAFAFAQHVFDWLARRFAVTSRTALAAAAAVVAALVVNVPTVAAWLDPDAGVYPDHKGAAQFVRSLQLQPQDIILAEDVLEQTYYLGRVDYWLIGRKHASRYVQRVDGEIRDFYTGTPVVDDGAQLREILKRAGDRQVIIIGSGENQSDRRRTVRGPEIAAVMASDLVESIFLGNDGLTNVWRARRQPVAASASAALAPQHSLNHSAPPRAPRG